MAGAHGAAGPRKSVRPPALMVEIQRLPEPIVLPPARPAKPVVPPLLTPIAKQATVRERI
jgi:hypothetical protein